MLRRTEESTLTSWYFEIDRRLLGMVLIFTVIGAVYAVSAGSVAAERIGEPWYFYIVKALPIYVVGLVTLLITSMLKKKFILGISVVNVVVGILLLGVTVVAPHIIKGSARFVSIGGFNVMPSDIMKPGFIMLTAWFLARMRDKYGANMFFNKQAWRLQWFSWWSYLVVLGPVLMIVLNHPDLGTAILYSATLGLMFLIAGLPWGVFLTLIGGGVMMAVFAFLTMSHVHRRVIAFFTGTGDTYQVDSAVQSIRHGGLLGGGDDAFVKQHLPDAHTDFIYAAIAEDMGAIVACGLLCLLLYMLARLIKDAQEARNSFVFYATSGAAFLFGTQVCINLATTLNIMPPKGMTLPFISYGGSSFVAFCLLFGMVLAIVREDKWK